MASTGVRPTSCAGSPAGCRRCSEPMPAMTSSMAETGYRFAHPGYAHCWHDDVHVRLSSPARDRRRADGRCRQAALETIERGRRQDSEHRTGAGKVLQGFDPGFRKPDTARRSRVGRAPDMNENARAAPRGAIARIVHEETAAVERTAAHVVGLHRTDVRALGDGIVKRRGRILHAHRVAGLELDVVGPSGWRKTDARSDAEETGRRPVVAFNLLWFLTVLDVEEGIALAKAGFADDAGLGRARAFPGHVRRGPPEELQRCKRRIHGLRRDQYEPRCLRERWRTGRRQDW